MPKPCSLELRERVVDAVESGASRREAADWFEVSPSSAIKWMQRRQATGSIAPKPSGGSISPLEAHAAFLFTLIARQPDLTLDEMSPRCTSEELLSALVLLVKDPSAAFTTRSHKSDYRERRADRRISRI